MRQLYLLVHYSLKHVPYLWRAVIVWNCQTVEEAEQVYAIDFARLKREYEDATGANDAIGTGPAADLSLSADKPGH